MGETLSDPKCVSQVPKSPPIPGEVSEVGTLTGGGAGDRSEATKQGEAAVLVLQSATALKINLKNFMGGQQDTDSSALNPSDDKKKTLDSSLPRTYRRFFPNASFWHSYLQAADAVESGNMKLYLHATYRYGEQLDHPSLAATWHTATLQTVAQYLTPSDGFLEASRIVRILLVAVKSAQLQSTQKVALCNTFLRSFLEFDEDVDLRFECFEHVVRTGQPAQWPPRPTVDFESITGELLHQQVQEESVFAYENYSAAARVDYLRMALKFTVLRGQSIHTLMEKEHSHVGKLTGFLCQMISSLVNQAREGGKQLELPANVLPHGVQHSQLGLALQLQFFNWVHRMVNWEPGSASDGLLIPVVHQLISIAISTAKCNREIMPMLTPEQRRSVREYLTTFALGMRAALPMILDPNRCCWSSTSSYPQTPRLFSYCRGRCVKDFKIFIAFGAFCFDGLEHGDFSENEAGQAQLREAAADFVLWVQNLFGRMGCTSQHWVGGLLTELTDLVERQERMRRIGFDRLANGEDDVGARGEETLLWDGGSF